MNDFQRYAKLMCANFCGSDGCLVEPAGDRRCLYFRDGEYPRCMWYEMGVLPQNGTLKTMYDAYLAGEIPFNSDPQLNEATCSRCQKTYIRVTNHQKYCPQCRPLVERGAARERKRKQRKNKLLNVTNHHF